MANYNNTMKETVLIFLALFTFTSVLAQQSLNDYKYVIVPKTFNFLKEVDEYRLNSLTKFLFEKYNFEVIMDGDEVFPSDYTKNKCLGLNATVLKDSNFFKTKLFVQLTNCKKEVIYTSKMGESREKSYKVAYNQALRNAFKNFETENYSYNNKNVFTVDKIIEVEEAKKIEDETEVVDEAEVEEVKEVGIQKLKEEIKVLKEDSTIIVNKKPEVILNKKEDEPVVQQDTKRPPVDNKLTAEFISGSLLNYYIKNSKGELVYTLLYSGQQDIYIVKGKDAIVSKINNIWVISQYVESDLKIKALDVKL